MPLKSMALLRFLWSILIPMSWNTIGALVVVQFVYVWDQYLWPRVIIRREENQVVQVGLNLIISTGEGSKVGHGNGGGAGCDYSTAHRLHALARTVYERFCPVIREIKNRHLS
ncbi:MAG: hypothetical protein R2865_14155 [Deinococcales bacterium]